jgi:hypothetical protein
MCATALPWPSSNTPTMWPAGDPCATPQWIAANIDGILATIERLYAAATDDQPGAAARFMEGSAHPALATSMCGRQRFRTGMRGGCWLQQ